MGFKKYILSILNSGCNSAKCGISQGDYECVVQCVIVF
jgi:hypothetical protein